MLIQAYQEFPEKLFDTEYPTEKGYTARKGLETDTNHYSDHLKEVITKLVLSNS